MKVVLTFCLVWSLNAQAQEYLIFYTRQVNNNDNIFTIDHLGRIEQITDHVRKDSSPRLSPDRTTLVFTSERVGWWKIWLMNLESSEFEQLTRSGNAEYSPDWSPDGGSIVFVSGRNGGSEIFTMDADGKNIKQLTNSKDNTTPDWAGDGKIYFSSKGSQYYQIWRMDPDGTSKEQLTSTKGDKLMPQLSPNQKSILYYGNQDGNLEVYVMDVNTRMSTRLTNHPLMDIRAQWSPDGKQIVFERGNKRNNQQICLMNADGSNLKQLTGSGYNYAPSFGF